MFQAIESRAGRQQGAEMHSITRVSATSVCYGCKPNNILKIVLDMGMPCVKAPLGLLCHSTIAFEKFMRGRSNM